MKVLFRMLASILPGVIVGLGVIAYLEREALQEQWMLYSAGEGYGAEHDHSPQPVQRWEQPVAQPRQIEIPEKFDVKLLESVKPVMKPAEEKAPVAMEKPALPSTAQPAIEQAEVATQPATVAEVDQPEQKAVQRGAAPQQDLAVVVGLEPVVVPEKRPEPEPAPPVTAPAPAPAERQQQLTSLMEQQRKVSEVIADQLPVLTEQIANLSKPIESLAQQFNPLSGAAPAQQSQSAAGKNIWALDEGAGVEESQLQWLWNRGRQAFWEENYEQAVESYRSLLEEDDKNPDAWGELGNIYYAKKDWVRAVRAFGRAAAALIEVDRVDEAKKIIQVIRTIDPALADQLQAGLGGRPRIDNLLGQ